jgi:excisionase family DNA binding protein
MGEPVIILQGITADEFWKQLEVKTRLIVNQAISDFNTSSEDQKLLSAKEVCSLLRITPPTLNSYCKAGKIKKMKLGSKVFFRKSDVDEAVSMIKPYLKTG